MATILSYKKENISFLAQKLDEGELVSFPTDTVYGLAANSFNEKALLKIYNYKKRPISSPLILHLYNYNEVEKYFVVNDVFFKLAEAFMPGPITLILNKKSNSKIHPICSNNSNKQAFRIPNNQSCLDLLSIVNDPVVATSANLSGQISPTKADHVLNNFKNKDLFILNDNKVLLGLESTILDITDQNNIMLLRHGAISIEKLKQLNLKSNIIAIKNSTQNYTFKTKIVLNSNKVEENEGLLAFGNIPFSIPNKSFCFNLSEKANLEEASSNLFSMLIKLDDLNLKKINIMPIPNEEIGITINQRLLKLPHENKNNDRAT